MEIRNVTRGDLPKLAELISCGELATRDDISFEHSAVAVDGNGTVVAFVIMRQRSLQDFFGGRIPDEPSMKDDDEYMEGDEFIFRNEVEENFPQDIHYEIIYSYESENDKFDHNAYKCYRLAGKDCILRWFDNSNKHITPILKTMGPNRNFNDIVSVDLPYWD